MNEISINLRFKEYEFRRIKRMGDKAVIYAPKEWDGKDVLIIPVPVNITDRWIEKQYNVKTATYNITVETDTIIHKTIKASSNIGRAYVPKELLGLDCIIIEAPKLDNF